MVDLDKLPQLVARWLEVGYPDKGPTPADAWHSALLQRLLDGKDPLPVPPPRAYSYPWYALIENGRSTGHLDIHLYPHGVPVLDDDRPRVTICQGIWDIVEDQGNDIYIVEWAPTGLRCRLEVYRRPPIAQGMGLDGEITVLA